MADEIRKLTHTAAEIDDAVDILLEVYTREEIDDLLNKKISAAEGMGLISDAERTKLSALENYDDTELRSDVTKSAEEAALNRSTLGYQRKNLLKPIPLPEAKSGVSIAAESDGRLIFSGTTTGSFTQDLCLRTGFESGKELFIRGAETLENCLYQYCAEDAGGSKIYKPIGTNGVVIPPDMRLLFVYLQQNTVGSDVHSELYPLVQYADIADDSYEPYKPSVEERLAALEAAMEVSV